MMSVKKRIQCSKCCGLRSWLTVLITGDKRRVRQLNDEKADDLEDAVRHEEPRLTTFRVGRTWWRWLTQH